ncbi:hypothetical protein WG915_05510 [Corynebacterium sp. H128]|uniref:hypothetical protein n=1 Tax=unclassified Corynebacterium TaxID=2624378 RepID=UPI003098D202
MPEKLLAAQPAANRERPESVQLAFKTWLVVVAFETVHQLLNVVMSLLNTSELKAAARESLTPEQLSQVSDTTLSLMASLAAIMAGVLAIGIVAVIGWTAKVFHNGNKSAEGARRFLTVFGVYLAIRALFVFEMAQGSGVAVALLLCDGYVQILVAVCAVLAAIFGGKKESVDWARAGIPEK